MLRNLPNLQVLNGLVVERDAIFSEDEDLGLNSDAGGGLVSSTDNIAADCTGNLCLPTT